MRTFFRRVQLVVCVLIASGSPLDGLTFSGDIKSDPSRLVEKYLSLDKRGARLDAQSQEVMSPYVAWTDEPAWGQIVVISKYQVIEDVAQWELLTDTEMLIPVTFEVIGTMYWESATFLPESQVYFEYFHVKAIDERWRIVAPLLPPHVGKKRLVNYVRLAILREDQESRKTALEHLREQLRQIP